MIYFGYGSDWLESDGVPLDSCTIVEMEHNNSVVKSPQTGDTGNFQFLMVFIILIIADYFIWRSKD